MSDSGGVVLKVGNRIILATEYGRSQDYEIKRVEELPNGRIALIVEKLEDLPA